LGLRLFFLHQDNLRFANAVQDNIGARVKLSTGSLCLPGCADELFVGEKELGDKEVGLVSLAGFGDGVIAAFEIG